ncbi:hypothetical protein DPMN_032412 [Dreissena polymorpha]|uniref:Exocyst complex component 7 n=1 Tax=Dreissena polymorpha TaxID=45954 RepID=A0A9D4RI82_DREPO|nr:hypothetical protein DPMN_032412 [Dreissena polymorpha]
MDIRTGTPGMTLSLDRLSLTPSLFLDAILNEQMMALRTEPTGEHLDDYRISGTIYVLHVHEVPYSLTDLLLEHIQTYSHVIVKFAGNPISLARNTEAFHHLLHESVHHSNNVSIAQDLLNGYSAKVLSALGLDLSNKSETYSDVSIKPIFMLNNFIYILKSLNRYLVHLWNKDVEMLYKDQIMEQKKSYSQSWSRVMHYIMEINEPMSS